MRYTNRSVHCSRGFTLIELMVAIAIIAVLLTIFFPHFIQARNRANLSTCKQNLKHIATALQAFSNDNGLVYPATLDTLRPAYLAEVPTCPAAGTVNSYEIGYSPVASPASFTVTCQGSFHTVLPDMLANQPYYVEGLGLQP